MAKEKNLMETLNQEEINSSFDDESMFNDVDVDENEDTPIDDEINSNVDDESTFDNTPSENQEETQEEVEETEQVEQQPQPFLNVRYNKEDVGLTQEQAIEYAQMGMNYGKLNEKYSALNGQLGELAQRNGMSVDEFIERLFETQNIVEVNNELEQLKQQYPDTNEEALMELAQSRVAQRHGEDLRQFQAQEEEQVRAQNEAIGEDINEVMEAYGLTADQIRNLPREIWQAMDSNGKSLLYNYGAWRRKQAEINKPQIEATRKAQELNNNNKKRSYGDTSSSGSVKESDEFLEGLFSED